MKIIPKSLAIGFGTETIFAGLFASGGFGPCGPNNPIGLVGMLAHLFPGIFIAGMLDNLVKLPEPILDAIVVISQALFWSACAYLYFLMAQKTDKLDEAGKAE